MSLQPYINFANNHSACYISTCDDDQPRVRGFWMWFADESGFYFHTSKTKEVGKQLASNPKVEICFFNNSEEIMEQKMMRLSGIVEEINDPELKTKLVKERPFLKEIQHQSGKDILFLFRIPHGEVHFWQMKDNMKEHTIPRLKF